LEISFETKALRTLCEDEEAAIEALGVNLSNRLRSRLADIDSAENFHEIPAGFPRIKKIEEEDTLLIDIGEEKSIYLLPNHTSVPVTGAGVVDWNRVTRVKIMAIE
jgi:hypothetical protein